jgi:citrate lyase gamma subunit
MFHVPCVIAEKGNKSFIFHAKMVYCPEQGKLRPDRFYVCKHHSELASLRSYIIGKPKLLEDISINFDNLPANFQLAVSKASQKSICNPEKYKNTAALFDTPSLKTDESDKKLLSFIDIENNLLEIDRKDWIPWTHMEGQRMKNELLALSTPNPNPNPSRMITTSILNQSELLNNTDTAADGKTSDNDVIILPNNSLPVHVSIAASSSESFQTQIQDQLSTVLQEYKEEKEKQAKDKQDKEDRSYAIVDRLVASGALKPIPNSIPNPNPNPVITSETLQPLSCLPVTPSLGLGLGLQSIPSLPSNIKSNRKSPINNRDSTATIKNIAETGPTTVICSGNGSSSCSSSSSIGSSSRSSNNSIIGSSSSSSNGSIGGSSSSSSSSKNDSTTNSSSGTGNSSKSSKTERDKGNNPNPNPSINSDSRNSLVTTVIDETEKLSPNSDPNSNPNLNSYEMSQQMASTYCGPYPNSNPNSNLNPNLNLTPNTNPNRNPIYCGTCAGSGDSNGSGSNKVRVRARVRLRVFRVRVKVRVSIRVQGIVIAAARTRLELGLGFSGVRLGLKLKSVLGFGG